MKQFLPEGTNIEVNGKSYKIPLSREIYFICGMPYELRFEFKEETNHAIVFKVGYYPLVEIK